MNVAQLVRLPTKTKRSWVQPLAFYHGVYDNYENMVFMPNLGRLVDLNAIKWNSSAT